MRGKLSRLFHLFPGVFKDAVPCFQGLVELPIITAKSHLFRIALDNTMDLKCASHQMESKKPSMTYSHLFKQLCTLQHLPITTIAVVFQLIFVLFHRTRLKVNPKKGFFTHWNSFQYAGRSLWHSHKGDSRSLRSPSSPWDTCRSWAPPHLVCSSRILSWGGIASFCWTWRWPNPQAGRRKLWRHGKRWLGLCAQGPSA